MCRRWRGVSVSSVFSWFGWKKVLVVAAFGVALFLASFLAAGKIGAYGFWGYQYGSGYGYQYDQYASGEYAGGEQTMVASYYGYELAGSPTASGEPFDPTAYTAAHKTMPLGTQLQVDYGGNSVTVTVNDRGPYVADRDLDLSQAAAETIGLTAAGADAVQVDVLN
jgi:rare lipoprotein A (peptidoglycan hydrolase)